MNQYQLPYQNYSAPSGQSNFGGVKSGTDIFGGVSDQSNPFGQNAATAQGTNAATTAIGNATAALTGTPAGTDTTATAGTNSDSTTNPLTGSLSTDYGNITLSPDQQTYVGGLSQDLQKLYENIMGFSNLESGVAGSNPSISSPNLPSFAYGNSGLDLSGITDPYTAAHTQFLTTPEGGTWQANQEVQAETKAHLASQQKNQQATQAAQATSAMPHTNSGITYGVGGSQLPFLNQSQIALLSPEQISRLVQIQDANPGQTVASEDTARGMLNAIGTSRGFDSGTGVNAPPWSQDYQNQKDLYGFNWMPVMNAGGGAYNPIIPPEYATTPPDTTPTATTPPATTPYQPPILGPGTQAAMAG
jgi:hypothetical protein